MLPNENPVSPTRRALVKSLGLAASLLAARRDAFAALVRADGATDPPLAAPPLLLHNNENPMGPGEVVLEAVRAALRDGPPAGRYAYSRVPELHRAIAERLGLAPENVVTGCGSTQILRSAVQTFTSPARPLVTGDPSYEEAASHARLVGAEVRKVPLDGSKKLDLDAMAAASAGAGMVFLDNPTNPAATVHSGDAIQALIERVLASSPEAVIVLDEAYHDYVTDPAYRSMVMTAAKNPRVVVARTFSKAHGMAGLRVGYAVGHPDTIRKIGSWDGANSLNVAGIAAATASIRDTARIEKEAARNTEARKYTAEWFTRAGLLPTESQTNFLFVNIGRPAKEFREACRAQGIVVARDFPPFEKTHARISIGTLDEMRRATEVFGKVLGVKPKETRRAA